MPAQRSIIALIILLFLPVMKGAIRAYAEIFLLGPARTIRGFPHADSASFVHEITSIPSPADLFMTTIFLAHFHTPGRRSPTS
jgi:hypothetical protein